MSVSRKPVSHEGLHVAPYSGLEANRDGLEPAHPQHSHHSQQYSPYSPHSTHKQEQYTDVSPKHPRKKLCGIPILTFWLLLVLIVALVVAGSLWIMTNLNANMMPPGQMMDLHMQR